MGVALMIRCCSKSDGALACLNCRQGWAALANEAGRLSRRGGAPVLSERSTRETLIAWLQWNDPNGSHTDEGCDAEGFEPYTLEDAWEVLAQQLT